ncbi:MAG: NAD(P)-dependent oxidoreductase [Alphaproteobacteria bacterium]
MSGDELTSTDGWPDGGRLLVTGATGMVGRNLCETLAAEDLPVLALGRNTDLGQQVQDQGIPFVAHDLATGEVDDLCALMREHGVTAVVHSAALASDWGPPAAFEAANVEATRRLLAAMQPAEVTRLVHVSTPSVYLDGKDRRMIKETDPLPRPINDYAHTKGQAERLIRSTITAIETEALCAVILRPRAILGRHDRAITPRLLAFGEDGAKVPMINGGRTELDFTHVSNVVSAIRAALRMPRHKAVGQPYNITNGEPMQVRQFVTKLYRAHDRKLNTRNIPWWLAIRLAGWQERYSRTFTGGETPPRLTKVAVTMMGRHQTLDISAARKDLGWEPETSVDEGLADLADWTAHQT